MKIVSLLNKRNQRPKKTKAQRKPTFTVWKKEYIRGQKNEIRHSVEDRQSWIAWHTVNEGRSTSRIKLKAASPEEQMSKEHFKNQLRNSTKVFNETITKIIDRQLYIQLGQIIEEKFNVMSTKIKSIKDEGLKEISLDVWKTRYMKDVWKTRNISRYMKDVWKTKNISRCINDKKYLQMYEYP